MRLLHTISSVTVTLTDIQKRVLANQRDRSPNQRLRIAVRPSGYVSLQFYSPRDWYGTGGWRALGTWDPAFDSRDRTRLNRRWEQIADTIPVVRLTR